MHMLLVWLPCPPSFLLGLLGILRYVHGAQSTVPQTSAVEMFVLFSESRRDHREHVKPRPVKSVPAAGAEDTVIHKVCAVVEMLAVVFI